MTDKGVLPVVLQAERSECALACLAMVLAFHGHRVDLHTLRNRCRVSGHGTSLKNLVNLAARLHLAARPLRLEPADLGKLALPAILHWKFDHFVILKKVSLRRLIIHDPAAGRREVSWTDAGKLFTGVALELVPVAGFSPVDERQHLSLLELWGGLTGTGTVLLQLLVLSLMLQVFALALPFYTQVVVDDVLVNGDVDLLRLLGMGFLLLIVFRQATQWLRARAVLYLGSRVSFQFATRLCRHLLHLPLEYFNRRHMGDIVSRFGSLNAVRDFLCSGMIEACIDGLMVCGALVMMLVYNSVLTLIALVAVILYAGLRLASYRALRARNEGWISDRAVEQTQFMENVSAIQGIKLCQQEEARLAGWQNCYARALAAGIRTQTLDIDIRALHGLLVGMENILLLLVGALAILDARLTIGMLMAFMSFKDHFFQGMFSLLDKVLEYRLLDMHLGRLADIAFTEAENQDSGECLSPPAATPAAALELDNLSFACADDQPDLFSRLSLHVSPGEHVVIIGPTGCGKSTLLRIVAGLVAPARGRILLDGRVATAAAIPGYRSQVGGVLQDDRLLSGSILENITCFDVTPDRDRVTRVVRLAALEDEVARLPMQLQTMTGSMGSALSGGQVQRILLARALYRQPRLLVLDEATSHLDVGTEARVSRALRESGSSCLMVAHRPETVLRADRILALSPTGLVPVTRNEFRKLVSKTHEIS